MAKEEAADAAPAAAAPAKPKAPLNPEVLVALLNTVAVLGVVGFASYSLLMFKRPQITESVERERIKKEAEKPQKATIPALLTFDPVTINILANPEQPKAENEAASAAAQGKVHYASIGFSLEIKDEGEKERFEALKPVLLDQFISLIGKKSFYELTTVQGRYSLRAKMIDIGNQVVAKDTAKKETYVSNIYFTQFVVQ